MQRAQTTEKTENNSGFSEAQSWIENIVERFSTLDMDIMLDCFSDDIQINYVGHPQMQGKSALKSFLQSRYASIEDYKLQKEVRFAYDGLVGVEAFVTFYDSNLKTLMEGRAFEILAVRDSLIERWDNISTYRAIQLGQAD